MWPSEGKNTSVKQKEGKNYKPNTNNLEYKLSIILIKFSTYNFNFSHLELFMW
jgi:hypothetical protein